LHILSIQSWVSFGHVGNAAACFPLQRLGAETLAINTVQFSNHTGYGDWTGQVFPGGAIGDLVAGIDRRGALASVDAVLSGYVGDPATAGAILDAVRLVRDRNPAALYACDPVIGDVGRGVFVRPGIADLFGDAAVPQADILTPNHFELALLAGRDASTLAGAKACVGALRRRMRAEGPRLVIVTSLVTDDTPDDCLDLLVGADDGTWRVRTPRLDIAVNGAGDLIAALFLFHVLDAVAPPDALARAASSVWGVIAHTSASGARELALVAAQAQFLAPTRIFTPEPV
jgi:pyridoxine kinase